MTENPHFFFFNRKERGSFYVLWILRYYTIVWIQSKKGRASFRKGIRESGIQDASTIIKKKKKEVQKYPPRGNIFIYFVSFWRHGRVVRRGTANPFSPVQIRVSPDQQNTQNSLFCSTDITQRIIPQPKWGKRTVDTCMILSICRFSKGLQILASRIQGKKDSSSVY